MSIASVLYNTVAKRTSTFVLAIGVSAFVFERGKDIWFWLIKWQYMIQDQNPLYEWKCYNSYSIFVAFDTGADWIWDNHNKGKLWKDIKHKYETED